MALTKKEKAIVRRNTTFLGGVRGGLAWGVVRKGKSLY